MSQLLRRGVRMNAIFPPLRVGLTKINRSRFKQSRNPLLISRIYVMGCFANFWVSLGGNSFSQWIQVKFREIRKIEDL